MNEKLFIPFSYNLAVEYSYSHKSVANYQCSQVREDTNQGGRIEQGQAYAWSRTRMGGWAVAQSPILGTTITLSRLRRKGYSSMLNHYLKTQPEIQWTPKYETRTLGGVRGALAVKWPSAVYSIELNPCGIALLSRNRSVFFQIQINTPGFIIVVVLSLLALILCRLQHYWLFLVKHK